MAPVHGPDTTAKAQVGAGDGDVALWQARSMPLFVPIPEDGWHRLAAACEVISRPAGTRLFTAEDAAVDLLVLVEGRVGLFADVAGGARTPIEVVSPVRLLGEVSAFDQRRHSLTADVLRDSRLVRLPTAALVEALADVPEFRLRMLAHMALRLKRLVRQIGDLKLKTGPQRLAGFLLDLAERRQGSAALHLPYEKRLLARLLGMAPESLSRSLKGLKAVGVQADRSDRIVIGDVDELRRFSIAESEPDR